MKDTVFHITYRPAIEFLYAFVYSQKENIVNDIKKLKGIKDLSLADTLEEINRTLSDYHKSEISYLVNGGWNSCHGIAQDIAMYLITRFPEIVSEEQLIAFLRETPTEKIAGIMFHEAIAAVNQLQTDEPEHTEDMAEIVRKLSIKKPQKEIYLYCIEHKEEVKERLIMAMQLFYEKAYKKLYQGVEKKTKDAIQSYEQELAQDAEAFSRKYHCSSIDAYDKELFIHLSYTRLAGSDLYTSGSGKTSEWLVLGLYSNEYQNAQDNGEDVVRFLKLIADRKRTQMIAMLKKQPAFVNEIADALNMTAPTASYHLTALQEYEIVDFERYEHRLYYHLNRDRLDEWFEKAKAYYLE